MAAALGLRLLARIVDLPRRISQHLWQTDDAIRASHTAGQHRANVPRRRVVLNPSFRAPISRKPWMPTPPIRVQRHVRNLAARGRREKAGESVGFHVTRPVRPLQLRAMSKAGGCCPLFRITSHEMETWMNGAKKTWKLHQVTSNPM
jgi:hypothetical protein